LNIHGNERVDELAKSATDLPGEIDTTTSYILLGNHSEAITLNVRAHSEVHQNTLNVSERGVLSQSDR